MTSDLWIPAESHAAAGRNLIAAHAAPADVVPGSPPWTATTVLTPGIDGPVTPVMSGQFGTDLFLLLLQHVNSSERSKHPDGGQMRTGKQMQNLPERRGLARAVLSGPVVRSSIRLATAVAVACGIVGFPGAGPAAADPVSLTLRYTCTSQLIENLPVTVRIDSDVPKSAAVGEPTAEFVVSAAVPVDADATKMLGRIGVKSVEGTMDAKARVAAPEGDVDVKFPGNVKADMPASGAFHVKVTGSAPTLTFRQPGSAKITVGGLVAHLTPRDASGDVTFPGRIHARCKLDAGQNNVMASFHITGTRTTAGASTSGTTGTTDTAASGTSAASGVSAADETASGATAAKPMGALSQTGAGAGPWLLGGAGVLLAAGAGAIFAARRTRTDDDAETSAV
ncbi:DUF6801 domain-containing protein [Streptomyces sp. NPDC060035]|uniref:DUF6801 domain-containing protein n=1 Tax=Streptomyces sp. NPDC060035 TaxID=3347044 RepID=UPI003694090A